MSPRTALVLLLTAAATAWAPRVAAMTLAIGHCATAGHPTRSARLAHASSFPSVSSPAPHDCSHCPAEHCSTPDHCTAAAPMASALGAGLLVAPTAIAAPALWIADRPLSANPTPPIPPPQLVR